MPTHIDYSQRKAFELGECFMTAGANRVFSRVEFIKMIIRHAENDWGGLCEEDKEANKRALEDGSRIVSKYVWPDEREALVITEAVRWGNRGARLNSISPGTSVQVAAVNEIFLSSHAGIPCF